LHYGETPSPGLGEWVREASARGAGFLAALWVVAIPLPGGSSAAEPAEARQTSTPAPPSSGPSAPELGEPIVLEEITVQAPSRLSQRRPADNGLTVQVVDRAEIEQSGAKTVQEALRVLPAAHLSDEQGTPFQLDFTLRGFTATPVTGVPIGLSVFLDGVRVNESDCEEINFDLIPLSDVDHIELIRGPSAIYGRNTLGGAIAIFTRRGGPAVSAEVEAEVGSFLEQGVRARISGPLGPLDGYLSVGEITEQGWRVEDSVALLQTFGKLGLRRDGTDVTLSYQFQTDRLYQPGSLPLSELLENPRQNYTAGDSFQPRLNFAILNASQQLAPGLSLTANGYFRSLDAQQYNSSALNPDTRLFNNTLSFGAALEVDHKVTAGPLENSFAAGAEVVSNQVRMLVYEEPNAYFTSSDTGVPLPTLGWNLSDAQLETGVFAQDQLVLTSGPLSGLGALVALRFDWFSHHIVDNSPADPGAANGDVSYQAWIPAASITYAFAKNWLASVSYSDGFRAPAFLELTCSNPQSPCVGLQSGVAPDPTFTPLHRVQSRSFEAGVSGWPLAGVNVAVNAFLVNVFNDIYSVTPPGTTLIYFQNVGDTRRQGLDLSLHATRGIFRFDATYAYTLATFQSTVLLATPRTESGVELVLPGNQLPSVPNHILNLDGGVRPLPWLTLSAGALFVSSQYLLGDEVNVGPKLSPYWLLRAGAEGRWGQWTAFARAENLANVNYRTFGTYSTDVKTAGQPIVPFLTPGLPIHFVLGVRWELD